MAILSKYTICSTCDSYIIDQLGVVEDYDLALAVAMELNHMLFKDSFDEILAEIHKDEEAFEPFLQLGGFGVSTIQVYENADFYEIIEDFKEELDFRQKMLNHQ